MLRPLPVSADATPIRNTFNLPKNCWYGWNSDDVAVRLNLLGQPGEQPDFVVASWVLPYVYALRGDRDWRRIPQLTGSRQVSPLAIQAYKHLETADSTISQLKQALGREVSESAVVRAITELWQQLRIIPGGCGSRFTGQMAVASPSLPEGDRGGRFHFASDCNLSACLDLSASGDRRQHGRCGAVSGSAHRAQQGARGAARPAGHAPGAYHLTRPRATLLRGGDSAGVHGCANALLQLVHAGQRVLPAPQITRRKCTRWRRRSPVRLPMPAPTSRHRSRLPNPSRCAPLGRWCSASLPRTANLRRRGPTSGAASRTHGTGSHLPLQAATVRRGALRRRRTASTGTSRTATRPTALVPQMESAGRRPGLPRPRTGRMAPMRATAPPRMAHSNGSRPANGNGNSAARNGKSAAPAWNQRHANGNGHTNGSKTNGKPVSNGRSSGLSRNSSAPRKDARVDARSSRGSRKPPLTAGAKAGNSKRYGFTARPKAGTKKRG